MVTRACGAYRRRTRSVEVGKGGVRARARPGVAATTSRRSTLSLTFSVPPRRRVRDSFRRAKRRSRKRRFSRVGELTFWPLRRVGFSVCLFPAISATSRCASALRRRHSCRHCPSAHAAVAPGSPRVHRARWARKPKENTAWVRVPCPRRRTAPRPSRRRRFLGTAAAGADSRETMRRRRARRRANSLNDAFVGNAVAFPRRRVSASIARASRRLSLSPSTRARHPARHGSPRDADAHHRRSFLRPESRRQVLLPGEGAGLPLARVVQARAAEPQV